MGGVMQTYIRAIKTLCPTPHNDSKMESWVCNLQLSFNLGDDIQFVDLLIPLLFFQTNLPLKEVKLELQKGKRI